MSDNPNGLSPICDVLLHTVHCNMIDQQYTVQVMTFVLCQ